MTLSQLQRKFTLKVAKLITWAYKNGYEFTFSEAYRPEETAKLYARQGRGIKNSLHTKRLAIDLNLFIKGRYQTSSRPYKPLAEYWKSLSEKGVDCTAGYDFGDGNHFSVRYKGVR